ncbi:Spy0128 family protein [Candidatus Enterococcus murrayae]|uniref:LPXTG cell wall anchor domain-containing protein n=1 Tax=Candidatus Enterococcus murrayae TaxID=2815321 RepID=A0ABS3HG13_9ENTE|nr:FctA domain-containing protein [Enterococcus sp. MJM16]MBO0451889.1 LPXTG cell wall anchor domain-containing protein [Enterococcus sp. MJM16]
MKKKFYCIISLLLIVINFFPPIFQSIQATATSTEQNKTIQSEQQPIKDIDFIDKVETDSSEAPKEDLTTRSSMDNQQENYSDSIQAMSEVDTVVNMSISDSTGNPLAPNASIDEYESFRINVDFFVPNNTVQSGDTTTLTLLASLKVSSLTAEFSVYDTMGYEVAKVKVEPGNKTITITYTDYVELNSDVSGSFYYYVQVDSVAVTEEKDIPIDITVNNGTEYHAGDIHYPGPIIIPETSIDKIGWMDAVTPYTGFYEIYVNRNNSKMRNVSLHDELENAGITIIPSTISITKGQWTKNGQGKFVLINTADVTANYTITMDQGNTGFVIELGDISETEGFIISYQTDISYDLIDGEEINNKVTINYDETKTEEKITQYIYRKTGGAAEGYTYSIEIIKKDKDNNKLAGAEFEVVRDRTNEVVGKITSDSNGSAVLNGLLKDDYTIKEIKAPQGYQLSAQEITISQNNFDENKYFGSEFINERIEGTVVLQANKVLNGKTLADKAFNFILKDENNQEIQTQSNDAAGAISFDEIKYKKAGTYKYTIQEVKGTEEGITYDDHVLNVTVTVEEKDGKLVATPSYSGEQTFVNDYKSPETSVVLQAKKVLNGKSLTNGAFKFILKDDKDQEIQTQSNDAAGAISFDEIKYKKAGTYKYTIQEVKGTEEGITYDNHVLNVTVTVEEKDGKLVATPSYSGGQTFVNVYGAPTGSAILQAKKVLNGKTLTDKAFKFILKDDKDQEIQTQSNDAAGAISFDEIKYKKAGTYKYTIQEVKGTEEGITYDDHVLNVTVTVEEKDGKLVATPSYSGEQTFVNTYKGMNMMGNQKNFSNWIHRKLLPNTGEQKSRSMIIVGIVIIVLLGIYVKVRNSRKSTF